MPADADGHGVVPDGFDLKIAVDAQFPCNVLLYAEIHEEFNLQHMFDTDPTAWEAA